MCNECRQRKKYHYWPPVLWCPLAPQASEEDGAVCDNLWCYTGISTDNGIDGTAVLFYKSMGWACTEQLQAFIAARTSAPKPWHSAKLLSHHCRTCLCIEETRSCHSRTLPAHLHWDHSKFHFITLHGVMLDRDHQETHIVCEFPHCCPSAEHGVPHEPRMLQVGTLWQQGYQNFLVLPRTTQTGLNLLHPPSSKAQAKLRETLLCHPRTSTLRPSKFQHVHSAQGSRAAKKQSRSV